MSILGNLKDDTVKVEDGDRLGGYTVRESGMYNFTVDMAYIDTSDSGAMSLNLQLKDNVGQLRQTFYITSSKAKGGKSTYINKKTGETQYLPGFNLANALSLLTVGKELHELNVEEKLINRYNPKEGKETLQQTNVITELLDQEITVGLLKQIVDKRTKDNNGNYVASGQTREENEVDKFFRTSDHKTVAEIRAQVDNAQFYDQWNNKWAGTVNDKSSKDSAISTGLPKNSSNDNNHKSLFA